MSTTAVDSSYRKLSKTKILMKVPGIHFCNKPLTRVWLSWNTAKHSPQGTSGIKNSLYYNVHLIDCFYLTDPPEVNGCLSVGVSRQAHSIATSSASVRNKTCRTINLIMGFKTSFTGTITGKVAHHQLQLKVTFFYVVITVVYMYSSTWHELVHGEYM